MNGQPPPGETSGEWPPEWEEEARRLEMYPAILYTWATTAGGSARLAIWRALPDASPREVEWSIAPIPDRIEDAARRAVAHKARKWGQIR